MALVDRVTGRLARRDRVGRTVVLRLRFADFKRATRSHTLGEPTDRTDDGARRRPGAPLRGRRRSSSSEG